MKPLKKNQRPSLFEIEFTCETESYDLSQESMWPAAINTAFILLLLVQDMLANLQQCYDDNLVCTVII